MSWNHIGQGIYVMPQEWQRVKALATLFSVFFYLLIDMYSTKCLYPAVYLWKPMSVQQGELRKFLNHVKKKTYSNINN